VAWGGSAALCHPTPPTRLNPAGPRGRRALPGYAETPLERQPHSRTGLTREAFAELLRHLDPDQVQAGALYNRHRQRLIQYFAWAQCVDPEALADEVIDRVARRLSEGEVVPKLGGYFLGVARLVALEQRHRAEQRRRAVVEYDRQREAKRADDTHDQRLALACLERCLDQVSPGRRAVILDYYTGSPAERIAKRQELATRLGLQPGALRNRALRLRQSLEECVAACRRRRDRDEPGRFVTEDQHGREDDEP
jgi:DNA-directed RNA polymerase specialized sigma24 family protein